MYAIRSYYVHEYELFLKQSKRKQKRYFIFRLASFSAIILSFIFFNLELAACLGLISFAVFLWVVRKSITEEREELQLNRLISINQDEIKALKGSFNHFDSGDEFINTEHHYTFDLDVFGKGSYSSL